MKDLLKLLGRIAFLLIIVSLAVVNYADDFALATGLQDPIIQRISEIANPANAVLLAAFVVVTFLLMLLDEEKITFGTVARTLERLATGRAFTLAEKQFKGNQTISNVGEGIKSLAQFVPKDSELYTLLSQAHKTAVDLYDGPEPEDT